MKPDKIISKRKKEHIELCMGNNVDYEKKTSGFEFYEFEHNAITQVDFQQIELSTRFFKKVIGFPFLISCMTGGTSEAEKINEKLAIAANELNIPIGVGSQRPALIDRKNCSTYKVVRKKAGKVPVLGNLGAAQVVRSKNLLSDIKFLIDLIEADAMVIHINPLQELLQPEGEPNFKGLLKSIDKIAPKIGVPLILKEVGSGISKSAARRLLNVGVKGIDVAGAGGTSWGAIELIRSNEKNEFFSEWGLSTSYCVRTVAELKTEYKFMLIASGGLKDGINIAKALALGADLTASARPLLKEVMTNDIRGVIELLSSWFETVKKIMYLTGCDNIKKFSKIGLKRKEVFV